MGTKKTKKIEIQRPNVRTDARVRTSTPACVMYLSVSYASFVFRTCVGRIALPAPPAQEPPLLASHMNRMYGAPAASAGSSNRWVSLQHVQHQIYSCSIQMKYLQHTSETVVTQHTSETFVKRLKTLESCCKHMQHTDKILAIYA